jgi:hypothetical protein
MIRLVKKRIYETISFWRMQRSRAENFFSCDKASRGYKKELKNSKSFIMKGKNTILVESNQSCGNVLGLSLFLPELARITDSKVSYYAMMPSAKITRLKQQLRNRFSVNSAIGVKGTFIIHSEHPKLETYRTLLENVSDARELELFEVNGIRIGDLIYDNYLRSTSRPTIDLTSKEFTEISLECIAYLLNFEELFLSEEISAVCISHCVYGFAIPARVAFAKGVPVFQVTGESIYRMNSVRTHAYTEFLDYSSQFKLLPESQKINGIELAKTRLDKRFAGQVAVDMPYSTKSAFSTATPETSVRFPNDNKLRILIATHDFYDSPHSYGDNFYPDFYIWLNKLGEISTKTDYHWYLKTHRDSVADDRSIFLELLHKYPRFEELHSDTSHHEIIEAGIDFALTVYGTIAMEYPALGVPVINASQNNPHVSYSFSITPKSSIDYEQLIMNLEGCKHEIDKSQIYEYYFMAHLLNPKSWIYHDYEIYLADIGGYVNSVSNKVFAEFLRSGDNRRAVSDIQAAVKKFINSGDFRLSHSHFV